MREGGCIAARGEECSIDTKDTGCIYETDWRYIDDGECWFLSV